MTFNDHITSFLFDHYSAFALGIDTKYEVADEGGRVRVMPPVKGHSALAQYIGACFVADEFDMSFFQDKPLDHGCFSAISMLWPHEKEWLDAIIPLQVRVLQFPIPSAKRCYKLGLSLWRAIESFPEDLSVVIVATGALSHQVHGERSGYNNTEWDMRFLDMIETDPVKLTDVRLADYARLGGFEGAEVIMWLIMQAALSENVRKTHQTHYLPTITALATAIYENEAIQPIAETNQGYRNHVQHQLVGVEKIAGTYPFTLGRSVKTYRLNKFLRKLIEPEHRRRFLEEPEVLFKEFGLTSDERVLVRRRDWRGTIQHGVIFFMLKKLGEIVGVSNLHIYAAMRNESPEDFLKTRNQPGGVYSVGQGCEEAGLGEVSGGQTGLTAARLFRVEDVAECNWRLFASLTSPGDLIPNSFPFTI